MMTNCYKKYDVDEIAYAFVRDELINYRNIKTYFRKGEDDDDYKQRLFNSREISTVYLQLKFQKLVSHGNLDYNYIMYRVITPAALEYAADCDILSSVADWIYSGNDAQMIMMYALSFADEILDQYADFMNDVLNNITAKKIAISKIKRNRIVNEGLLLKLSMRDCGMF